MAGDGGDITQQEPGFHRQSNKNSNNFRTRKMGNLHDLSKKRSQ